MTGESKFRGVIGDYDTGVLLRVIDPLLIIPNIQLTYRLEKPK